jgi:hypothetical protein
MSKSKNKLYTLSYFRKRLREVGISTEVVVSDYDEQDKRYWTISIDGKLKILCTCLKYTDTDGSTVSKFHFSDCKQSFKMDMVRETVSMEDIISMLSNVLEIDKKY